MSTQAVAVAGQDIALDERSGQAAFQRYLVPLTSRESRDAESELIYSWDLGDEALTTLDSARWTFWGPVSANEEGIRIEKEPNLVSRLRSTPCFLGLNLG